jgi:hypothetical protein
VTGAANALGVTRQALNNLVNGRSGISPEMAIRLDLPSPKRSFSFAQEGNAFAGGRGNLARPADGLRSRRGHEARTHDQGNAAAGSGVNGTSPGAAQLVHRFGD